MNSHKSAKEVGTLLYPNFFFFFFLFDNYNIGGRGFFFFFDNSIITMRREGFEPWVYGC